jgi:CpeT protein
MDLQEDPTMRRHRLIFASAVTLAAFAAAPLAGLAGCASSPGHGGSTFEPGVGFTPLVETFTGTFDSSAQAEAEPEAFFNIRLVMYRIWEERSDAAWFYVEQAEAGALDEPYRQRIYRVAPASSPRPELYHSDVYLLPNRQRFVAGWENPDVFDDLSPEDLELRDGCTVVLNQVGPWQWNGSTIGTDCSSDMAGASYAVSEVQISPVAFETWDRGYDEAGEQVWGSTEGPYKFVKQSSEPPSANGDG